MLNWIILTLNHTSVLKKWKLNTSNQNPHVHSPLDKSIVEYDIKDQISSCPKRDLPTQDIYKQAEAEL